MTMQEIRDRIVTAAVPHVVFDGWTPASLRAAAEDAGLDPDAASRAFPAGVAEVVEHFLDLGDRHMLAALAAHDMRDMKTAQRLNFAIRTRLEQLGGDREAVRRALSVMALPINASAAVRATYRTVDAIWYGIGDTTTDLGFYTKRLALAGIYPATLLFWLGDSSEDSVDTWNFLERRIGDMTRLVHLREDLQRKLSYLPSPLRFLRQARGRGMGGGRAEFL